MYVPLDCEHGIVVARDGVKELQLLGSALYVKKRKIEIPHTLFQIYHISLKKIKRNHSKMCKII